MNEQHLTRLLTSVAPDLPAPPDRLAAVRRRVERRRQRTAVAGAGLVTVVVGGLGVAALQPGHGNQPIGTQLFPGPTSPPTSSSANSSAAPSDGVLRTLGCGGRAGNAIATPSPGTSNSDISGLLLRMRPYLSDHFSDVYAGGSYTDVPGALRVYRKPSAAFDAWIMQEFARDCVEVVDAKYSLADMNKFIGRLWDDADYWSERGIDITMVNGDAKNGVLEVTVTPESVDQARQKMPARYPDVPIAIKAADVVGSGTSPSPR
jgi:hypothetical protein